MQYRWLYSLIAVVAIAAGSVFYQVKQSDFITLDGTKHKLADFSGQYVIVNYFAEWCAPCLKEIPELNKLEKIKPNNTALFAVSFDKVSAEKLQELKTKYNMQFPLIKEIYTPFPFDRPQFLPATFILNPDGSLKGKLFGEQSAENLLNVIQEAQNNSQL